MLINILADGTTQNISPKNIYQGSNRANTIYVLAPFAANIKMYMSFEIEATGEITQDFLLDSPLEVRNDLNVWQLDVEKILTQYYGSVKYQIRCVNGEQIVCTGRGRFQVIEGVDVILPDAPTQEVYELILAKLSDIEALFLNGWIEAQGLKPFNSEFSYSLGAFAIGENEGKIEIYKSLKEANKGNSLNNREAWQVVSHFEQSILNKDAIEQNTQDIASLDGRVTQNTGSITQQGEQIGGHEQRLVKLESEVITGFTYIGKYPSQEVFPNSNELTQFVYDNTVPNRSPKPGDTIKFTLVVPNESDKNYSIIFQAKVWGDWIEELPVEKAGNNKNYGSVSGNVGEDKNVEVNLFQGDFVDITTKNSQGDQISIATRLNSLDDNQRGILNGTKAVGLAQKSIGDKDGNPINTTYIMKGEAYTKNEADRLFLSSNYANVMHYSKDGIVDNTPTEPENGKQFEIAIPFAGTYTLFDLSHETITFYNFNKNSSDRSVIWIKTDKDCSLDFRLTTKGVKSGVEKILNADLTGEIAFKGNTIKAVDITSIFNGLGNEEYELEKGDFITKKLEVISSSSDLIIVSMFSSQTYDSTLQLLTSDKNINFNSINGKKKINILASEWTDNGDGSFNVTIPQSRHEQAPSNEYGLDLQQRKTASSVERISFTPTITDDGDITIKSYEAIDCELLIWSAIQQAERGIIKLTNPKELTNIDYTQIGAITITQTEKPPELTLPLPANVSQYYTCFVSDNKISTHDIHIEGNTVKNGNGLKFKWNGDEWQIDEMPDKTSEITDDLNNQPLNDTLATIPNKANKDGSNIQVEVWKNILGVDLKANNKSVELKNGLEVDNLIDFFRYFYDLRKGLNDTWEFEVGEGKNENIMNIFGFPYGESPTDSAELIVKRIATSGIGYTLELTFASKKSNTTHTAFVRGWIISGTSYDKYIHFTGWRNARGGQWVDEVNGDITLTDTNEIVLNIGEFKNPYNNFLIAEITKNNHSYNAFLMLSITAPNVGETTVKLDNEDVYVKLDYNAKTFTISKTSSGTESLKVHLYERLI